jgi:hypothetical protein
MTYADLLENLKTLTKEQLEMDVTVYVSGIGEFYPLMEDYPWVFADEGGTPLDADHPYMVI